MPKAKAPRKSSRARIHSAKSSAGKISHNAKQIAQDSHKLYRRARRIQTKADEVHHGIESLHHAVHALHRQPPPDSPDATEIVTDDKSRGNGQPFTIVGVGASAGGYEAFGEFLTNLPKDTGMAIVLVQHLDPNHKSKLTELLGHSSKVPVTEVRNDMPVEPDHIFVIPENATMTISGGKLRLSQRKEGDLPPMPIDIFFRSLAQEQQNRAIGVVLCLLGVTLLQR